MKTTTTITCLMLLSCLALPVANAAHAAAASIEMGGGNRTGFCVQACTYTETGSTNVRTYTCGGSGNIMIMVLSDNSSQGVCTGGNQTGG